MSKLEEINAKIDEVGRGERDSRELTALFKMKTSLLLNEIVADNNDLVTELEKARARIEALEIGAKEYCAKCPDKLEYNELASERDEARNLIERMKIDIRDVFSHSSIARQNKAMRVLMNKYINDQPRISGIKRKRGNMGHTYDVGATTEWACDRFVQLGNELGLTRKEMATVCGTLFLNHAVVTGVPEGRSHLLVQTFYNWRQKDPPKDRCLVMKSNRG